MLELNLAALAQAAPALAAKLLHTQACPDLRFVPSDDGVLAVEIADARGTRALCSRRHPLVEAERFAQSVDVRAKSCILLCGVGAGYHVSALSRRMLPGDTLVVYEPDLPLLRGVLERIDQREWLGRLRLVVLNEPDDPAGLSAVLTGHESSLALGVKLVEHPASRDRLGASPARLYARVTEYVGTMRVAVNTSLVQIFATLRNCLSNLERYACGPGAVELEGCGRGRPAVVVAAGPSLARNLDQLADPRVRESVVIIAAQTALKPMLARGIRPHFVTALDHHEISGRFYTGLTPRDVDGVTLVAEPQANPIIPDSFPGRVRLCSDRFLDQLLGPRLARPMGEIPLAATVAHMSYLLARYMGCDPVVLVGQDLGFTDGQYYAAGAAIHETWACELNPFNTLEMLEWQRVKRMGSLLRRVEGIDGRAMYTDAQMAAYLDHFQRDFAADAARGLRTIDASEGGVRKQHAEPRALRDVLAEAVGTGGRPVFVPPAPSPADPGRLNLVRERVRSVRSGVTRIVEWSRRAEGLLAEMLEHQADQNRVNRLIGELDGICARVTSEDPAYALVQGLNQAGALKRLAADRAIETDSGLDSMARQRAQIERDAVNVQWIREAALELGAMLDMASACLDGAPRPTRDAPPLDGATGEESVDVRTSASARVVAVVPVDLDRAPSGLARDLTRPFLAGLNPLELLLRRLDQVPGLSEVVLVSPDPRRVHELLARLPGSRVRVEHGTPDTVRARAMRAARAFAPACWRGGIGGASTFDECLDPGLAVTALNSVSATAALVLGADWCLVDPALCELVIQRHLERPAHTPLVFTQALCGLAPCVAGADLLKAMHESWNAGFTAATLGGALSYHPSAPTPDAIGEPHGARFRVVQVDARLRGVGPRLIPDSPARRSALGRALESLGPGIVDAGGAEIAHRVLADAHAEHDAGPSHLVLELCPGRMTSGRRAHWERGSTGTLDRVAMPVEQALRLLHQLAERRPDAAVTIAGFGDPLNHPGVLEVLATGSALVEAGRLAGVHLRTDLVCEPDLVDAVAGSGVDVVSVDLMAETPGTYAQVMGAPLFERARANVARLLEASRSRGAGTRPWVVPRITRCDHTLDEIENFHDRWIAVAGASAIDPLPLTIPGQRIAPLPPPRAHVERTLLSRMTVLSDGCVPVGELDAHGSRRSAGNAFKQPLGPLWRELVQRRRALLRDAPQSHPDLRIWA